MNLKKTVYFGLIPSNSVKTKNPKTIAVLGLFEKT